MHKKQENLLVFPCSTIEAVMESVKYQEDYYLIGASSDILNTNQWLFKTW